MNIACSICISCFIQLVSVVKVLTCPMLCFLMSLLILQEGGLVKKYPRVEDVKPPLTLLPTGWCMTHLSWLGLPPI